MSEQSPNDPDIARLSPATRIRAVADGELGSEHLDGADDAEARVAFERALREGVARAMSGSATEAPPQLRERVQAILNAAPADQPDVVRTLMGDTRERSFWSGVRRAAAIAAVLVVCATIFIMSSKQGPPRHSLHAGLLASFVEGEHEHCEADETYALHKLEHATSRVAAEALAKAHLGGAPRLIREGFDRVESAGFRFAGMGRCKVPGAGRSVHLVFRDAQSQADIASLFIQVDRSEWDLERERCARVNDGLDDEETVFVWLDEGYIHILFVDLHRDGRALRAALQAPDQEVPLKAR